MNCRRSCRRRQYRRDGDDDDDVNGDLLSSCRVEAAAEAEVRFHGNCCSSSMLDEYVHRNGDVVSCNDAM